MLAIELNQHTWFSARASDPLNGAVEVDCTAQQKGRKVTFSVPCIKGSIEAMRERAYDMMPSPASSNDTRVHRSVLDTEQGPSYREGNDEEHTNLLVYYALDGLAVRCNCLIQTVRVRLTQDRLMFQGTNRKMCNK